MSFKANFELLNKHIKRHTSLMIVACFIISLVALMYTIYWSYDPNDISYFVDYFYLAANIFFLVISLALTTLLILSKKYNLKPSLLSVSIHIYVLLLIVWDTIMCVLDLSFGYAPVAFFMIYTIVAGLFVIEPLFFAVVIVSSASVVLSIALSNSYPFFDTSYWIENLINSITFVVIVLLVGGAHYGMVLNDYRIERKLEHLTYYDDLTGLLNERSYLNEVEAIDKLVEEGKLNEYAVILVDLNNLKATNDKYGHRYGCHLVVRSGEVLPKHFKSSKLFHVGGDEFVIIVYKEDYENLDNIMKLFDDELSYSLITYEGKELIYSLAHGYSRFKKGQKYKDVFQIADKLMYENKAMLKEKYGMAKR